MNITLRTIGDSRQICLAPDSFLVAIEDVGIDDHCVKISMNRQLPPHSRVASPRKDLLEKPFLFQFLHHTVVEKLLGFKFFRFRAGLGALLEDEFQKIAQRRNLTRRWMPPP